MSVRVPRKSVRKLRVLTEAQIQRGILDTCAVRRVYAMRINSGAQAIPAAGGQARRFVRFGEKGAADLMAILPDARDPRRARPFFIEVKRPGNRPSAHQFAWLLARQQEGAVAIWVDHAEKFDAILVHLLGGGDAVLHADGTIDFD